MICTRKSFWCRDCGWHGPEEEVDWANVEWDDGKVNEVPLCPLCTFPVESETP
jgi:hypothetical protein